MLLEGKKLLDITGPFDGNYFPGDFTGGQEDAACHGWSLETGQLIRDRRLLPW